MLDVTDSEIISRNKQDHWSICFIMGHVVQENPSSKTPPPPTRSHLTAIKSGIVWLHSRNPLIIGTHVLISHRQAGHLLPIIHSTIP